MTRLGATEKVLPRDSSFQRRQEIAGRFCFYDVAPGAQFKSGLHNVSRRFLSQEHDFRFRDQFANLSGGFHSIQTGEANVQ